MSVATLWKPARISQFGRPKCGIIYRLLSKVSVAVRPRGHVKRTCLSTNTDAPSCGHELEALQRLADAPLTECPACHKTELKKLAVRGRLPVERLGLVRDRLSQQRRKAAGEGKAGQRRRGCRRQWQRHRVSDCARSFIRRCRESRKRRVRKRKRQRVRPRNPSPPRPRRRAARAKPERRSLTARR